MKSKKMIGLLMSAVMCAGLLAGCGDSGSEESSPAGNSQGSESTQDSSGSSDDAQSGGESQGEGDDQSAGTEGGWSYQSVETLENPNVTIALYWDADDVVKSAIAEFEAKYGGKVTVNVVGWNKGADAIQEAMATGDLFDLVYTEGNARFPGDAVDKLYQPIDQYLDYSVCDKASADAFLYRGEHYVYTNSAITSPYLIIYNKTLFSEEGKKDPVELYEAGEWTYDKFLEYMEYFTRDTDGDGEIDQWGLGPRFKRQNFGFANDGMPVYEVGDGKLAVGIDTEECMQWFDFLNKFGQINTSCPGDSGWLEARQCAMFSEAGPSAGLSNDGTSTDEFDFVPLPTYDGRQATTPVWDNGYAMVNGAPNPEGAAVLASMICKAKLDNYTAELESKYTAEQIARYNSIMEKIVPQRRNYANVSHVGEGDALDGSPAQTIVETYKSQLEAEVEAYNAALEQ